MLTFPPDKSDFRAPNGVTYAWDGVDGKWRVKAFRSIDDFIVNLQDNPPTADESKIGDLWFDTSDESLTLFVYTGDEWVPAAPPVSLDGINATIDAALIVQNDLLARVEAGEIVQTGVLDNLTTLQNKVEALEGTVIDGKWNAESRSNPREGGFDLTSGGLQSMADWSANYLRVHKTDSTGKAFTFAEVSTGDYIRIGAPGSTAVYKINEVVSGSLDWQAFGVELANSTGTPIPDLTYDFEFLPSFDPSAYATIQYVDAQDDLDVKLAAVNDVSTGFRIKSGNNTLISTATEGELGLYHVKDPSNGGNASWAANKGYVDDNFINIAGQTDLDPQVFKLRQRNSEGNFNSFINIHNGDMHLYNVADPSGSGHEKWAANKEYVDNQIASINSSINLDGYLPLAGGTVTGNLTVEGVAQFAAAKNSNAPVAGADLTNKSYTDSTFRKKTDRPGLKFMYQSGSDVPASGKFTWYNSGGQRLKINATTKDGIPWAVDTPIGDINFSEGHLFTIWATVSGTDNWRQKRFGTINRIDYHADDILCYISFFSENGSFSTSAEYNITIAGLI